MKIFVALSILFVLAVAAVITRSQTGVLTRILLPPGPTSTSTPTPTPSPTPSPSPSPTSTAPQPISSSTLFLGRGALINSSITEENFAALAADGATLVRPAFSLQPLRDLTPPYAINNTNFALLDRDLDLCEKYGMRMVIDPHTFPGMTDKFTTHASDPFWSDPQYGTMAVELWSAIAKHLASRGSVVAGYDLLNEPTIPDATKNGGGPGDYNALVARMVAAIRAYDKVHPIIIEAAQLSTGGGKYAAVWNQSFASYLAAPPDSNVIYSFHMYQPNAFAMQGTPNSPALGVTYPGMIGGQTWNASAIANWMAPIAAFQQRYHVPIYMGEFGAVRWTGDAGVQYMKDIIDYAEAHQWSWTYTSWRGADQWDMERDNYNMTKAFTSPRLPSTPRMDLLKNYFTRGDQPWSG